MTPEVFTRIALVPALSLLPPRMDSPAARAMVIAICLQESALRKRRQTGGPARGYAQFEFGGVSGVLTHSASYAAIRAVLDALDYDYLLQTSYDAIENNDVLACAYARCLLWTLPDALPGRLEADEGWRQYVDAWRPGKPHRATWDAYFEQGWKTTEGTP